MEIERDTDVENECMDTKGERGTERHWETGTDTYTRLIPCVKQITHGNMLCSTGKSSQWTVMTGMKRRSKREG